MWILFDTTPNTSICTCERKQMTSFSCMKIVWPYEPALEISQAPWTTFWESLLWEQDCWVCVYLTLQEIVPNFYPKWLYLIFFDRSCGSMFLSTFDVITFFTSGDFILCMSSILMWYYLYFSNYQCRWAPFHFLLALNPYSVKYLPIYFSKANSRV